MPNKLYRVPGKPDTFEFNEDGSEDDFIPKDAVALTEAEAEAYRNAPPTHELLPLMVRAGPALRVKLNVLARSWGWDEGYNSARGWVGDPNPKFHAEALALVQYGSACYTILDQLDFGAESAPTTIEAFMALLPAEPAKPVVAEGTGGAQ